jgi:hypothetical protein
MADMIHAFRYVFGIAVAMLCIITTEERQQDHTISLSAIKRVVQRDIGVHRIPPHISRRGRSEGREPIISEVK